MRAVFLLLVFLVFPVCAFATPTPKQTLTFEKVIDSATIVASGKTVALWGVKALDPSGPTAFAANQYLKTMLWRGALTCDEISSTPDRQVMHCYSDGADVGSLMVQTGMARAADAYYKGEEGYAQAEHRGVWQRGQGAPL